MKHDELLLGFSTCDCMDCRSLRAILDLHKPVGENVLICEACNPKGISLDDVVYYPCPTVQIIEREQLK